MIDQEPFACRLLWGRNGLAEALRRRDILVVVDVLRFTSTAITAQAVSTAHARTGAGVTVLACGERFVPDDGDTRFALEDYLGAAAVLASLDIAQSPEAELAVAAFSAARANLPDLVARCSSGQELFEREQCADVAHCARLDGIPIAAGLAGGRIVRVG